MRRDWDMVVVGTGFGGSMVALAAVRAGLRVLLIERGRWVDRDDSAWDPRTILIDRKYRSASPFETPRMGFGRTRFFPDEAVGGKSVFYGAASFRLREDDFRLRERYPDLCSDLVDWPIDCNWPAPLGWTAGRSRARSTSSNGSGGSRPRRGATPSSRIVRDVLLAEVISPGPAQRYRDNTRS